MQKLRWLPQTLLLILTFLLPLKFGSSVGVPEMPMSYWHDPLAILVAAWPVMLFPLLSAVALDCAVLLYPMRGPVSVPMRLYGCLWILLSAVSLPGWLNATTWDFAIQNTVHLLGMTCWTLALIRVLENSPEFRKYLFAALLTGLLFSVYSAVNQYLSGFDETIRYLQDKEAATGVQMLNGQFGSRLKEARVSGDFTICNSYAGYLVLVFPLLLGTMWKLGSRVTPPLPAKLLLTLPCAGVFLFLLKETGSRGGILAMLAGAFLILPCLRLPQKWKYLLWSLVPAGLTGFFLLVKFGRGFNSMLIRFDYFQAALKMMFLHPFTGAGWGEFLNDYLILKNVVNDEAPHSPHNFVLTLGSQCGIPAFLISCVLLALPLIAALVLLSRRSREQTVSFPDTCFVWGLGAWTFHSMLELNYETPGALALAVLISLLISGQCESLPGMSSSAVTCVKSGGFRLTYAAAALAVLIAVHWLAPVAIRAERNYDVLHSAADPRFAADPMKVRPAPAEIMKMLKQCDARSPFPFSTASSYCLSLGPYYADNALELLDKAIERAPKRAAYYYRKYRILKNLPGRTADAEAALRKARELSPKNPVYYPNGITPFGARSY